MTADRVTALSNQLVDVHLKLRDELARLQADVGARPPRDLRLHCLAFCSALTQHHSGEDDEVFALLAQEFPELEPDLAQLRHDHDMVTEILRTVEELVGGLNEVKDPSAAELRRVRGELDGLAALLESHFRYEEKKLRTALDALDTESTGRVSRRLRLPSGAPPADPARPPAAPPTSGP